MRGGETKRTFGGVRNVGLISNQADMISNIKLKTSQVEAV
ncbi:hypothetical protein NSP_48890 [Nodularia spumigena CCY9414]|nr:hypothetical protein NSP_48890 [Nodularia spumigena CCY9414]